MSQSEDYLDGLLNAITKKDNSEPEPAQEIQQEVEEHPVEEATPIAEELFSGIKEGFGGFIKGASSLRVHREPLTENDFIRDFEAELESGDADAFIEAFEKEIDEEERLFEETGTVSDSEAMVAAMLDGGEPANHIAESKDSDDNTALAEEVQEPIDNDQMDSLDIDSLMSQSEDLLASDNIVQEESADELLDASLDIGPLSEDMPEDLSVESLDEEQLEEMDPDANLDILAEEFGIEIPEGEEVDLSDSSNMDLDGILMSSSEDEDLMDIKSLLDGAEDLSDEIDESMEEDSVEDGKKKKKKKTKDGKKGKNSKSNGILSKISLILFGPPDEDDLEMIELDPAAKEAAKEAKKAEKQAKKEAKEAAKKEKEAEKKAKESAKPPKPPKEPKPKKPKKQKEPDNSPKIPLGVIAVFLLLSASIISVVLVGMNYMGVSRHMEQAMALYDNGEYILAYEKLNGLVLTDDEDVLTRNRARLLADMQQCQDEYIVCIGQGLHEFALDSLIKGVGRYEKFKDEADEYGVSPQYEVYINYFDEQLSMVYGLSRDDAMFIYKQKNRHYYTIELRKVLIRLGLDE